MNQIKLLVVTGGPTLRHKIDLVPSGFYTLFEGYPDLEWDHASDHEAAFMKSRTDDYDVILFFNHEQTLSASGRKHLKEYVESDNGVVIFHSALGSYNDWDWWWKEVVGAKYQNKDTDQYKKTKYYLDTEFKVTPVIDHPISHEIGEFLLDDELYQGLNISDDARVVFETEHQISDGPVVWISPYIHSRVVVIQPGHANKAYRDLNFRKIIYQSIKWCSQSSKGIHVA